jgi:hypothetical protein
LTGFKMIIDLTFDQEGNLYVLQYTSGPTQTGPGTLIRVAPNRSAPGGICEQYQTGMRTTLVDGLRQPTSVAIGPDGALYLTNHGASAGIGEVLRIEP